MTGGSGARQRTYDGEVESEVITYSYPNPFTDQVTIEFILPEESFVVLSVLDHQGRNISRLVSEKLPAGKHSRQWKPEGNANGLYFYQLKTNVKIVTEKLIKR